MSLLGDVPDHEPPTKKRQIHQNNEKLVKFNHHRSSFVRNPKLDNDNDNDNDNNQSTDRSINQLASPP
eukprot:jgi/Psemu1/58032/gm1.58032_g